MAQLQYSPPHTEDQETKAKEGGVAPDRVADHADEVASFDWISPREDFKLNLCPNSRGSFVGIWVHEGKLENAHYRAIRTNLTCKQWGCPVCGERNKAQLMARIWEGDLVRHALELEAQGVKYALKHLILTLPGKEWRLGKDPEEAVEVLLKNLNKLNTAIRKQFGFYDYFWVVEWKRGFPHLHMLMVGRAIVPRELLGFIKRIWLGKYGMGYVKLRSRRREFSKELKKWVTVENSDVRGQVGYLCKYLGKDLIGEGVHGKHHFGASRGALAAVGVVRPKTGWFLMGQMSGRTIQEEDDTVLVEAQELFIVSGAAHLYEEIDALVAAGVWDPDGDVIRGTVSAEENEVLRKKFGKFAVLPGVKRKGCRDEQAVG